MENIDSLVWGFGIGLFFLGIAVGIALSRFNDKYWRQKQSLEREMHSLSNDFHAYRTQVADHFIGSAKLLNKLTEDYRNMYHHLAVSSENLVGVHISDVLEFKNAVIVDDLLSNRQHEKTSATTNPAIDPTIDDVVEQTIANKKAEIAAKEKKTPKLNLAKENTESKKAVSRKKTTRKTTKTSEPSMEDSQSLMRTLELVKEQVQEKVEEEKTKAKRGRPRKTATKTETASTTTVRKATKRPKKTDVELESLDSKSDEDISKEKIA